MGLMNFASGQAFRLSFETVFANISFFLPLMIGLTIVSYVLYIVVLALTGSALLSEIAGKVVNSAIAFALFKISLGFLESHQLNKTNLFSPDQLLIKYIAASLLFWLMVYLSLMLLIVPCIYILLTYSFYGLEMVEKGLEPIDALKRSAEITKGAKWSLLRLGLEFCCGLFAINVVLFILLLFPFVSLGVMIVFLQAMHLAELYSIMPVLISAATFVIVLAVTLIDAAIVIPAYALTFTSVYRTLEPERGQAGATALHDEQEGDGKTATIEPELSDSTEDRPLENGSARI
jgi:hypothetical protein